MVTILFFKIRATQLFKSGSILFLFLIFIHNGMFAMDSKNILANSVANIIENKSVLLGHKEAGALLDCLVEVINRPYSQGNAELIRLSLKSLKNQLKLDIKQMQEEALLDFFDEVCRAYGYATNAENQFSSHVKNDGKQPPTVSPRALSGSPLRQSFVPKESKSVPEKQVQKFYGADQTVIVIKNDENNIEV